MLKMPGLPIPGKASRVQGTKQDAKVWLKRLEAWGLAALGVLLSLWLWQILAGAVQWFSLAYGLIATGCYLAAHFVKPPLLKDSLSRAGSLCTVLAIWAGLGLGAFLPSGLADFLSPALGRFGGLAGLLVLAILQLGRGIIFRKSGLLDLALFCGIGAVWVALNTAAQANFPAAPSTKEDWAALLNWLFWLGLTAGLSGLGLSFLKGWSWVARSFWRWSVTCSLVGLALAVYFQQSQIALRCGLVLVGLAVALGLLFRHNRSKFGAKAGLKQAGAVALIVLGLVLLYLPVGEQLETVLLRDTLERYALKGWSGVFGGPAINAAAKPAGTITGQVKDERGQPLAGANVVVSDSTGFSWTAASDANGRYSVTGVAASHYLPMSARAGYLDAVAAGDGPLGRWRLVASVRSGQTTSNIDFVMKQRQPYRVVPGNTLQLDEFTEISRENPVPSRVLRRTFSFENDGLQKSGIVYEPLPDQGAGPFPILLIVYPGPANAWEGVSIPLAAQGFVVIAYQPELFGPHPERGLNLRGDLKDLLELYNYAKSGYFSTRSDPQKVVITAGSVSTAYTYLLLNEIETSSPADKAALKGNIAYGGLADLYRYRYDWERGALYIDPGIQDLETMLIALGRPDLRPEIYMLFSPVYHLEPGSLPPTLLVHTSKDTIVPIYQNTLLLEVLEKLKLAHQNVIYTDIEHYLDTSKPDPSQRDMLEKTIQFLKEYTK